jgi:hypothetical protein
MVDFNTTVTKNVTINKTVDLTVEKFVTSTVDIQGCLATAEGSADATGGGTGARGSFVIDDFNGDFFPENTVIDRDDDGVAVSSTTVIDAEGSVEGPCNPLFGDENDGPNWVMNAIGGLTTEGQWQRVITADLLTPDAMETQICAGCDAGHLVSGAGGPIGTSTFEYQGPAINVLAQLGCADIDQICFKYASDTDGAVITFTFTGGGQTIVVSTDDDPQYSGGLPNTDDSNVENFVSVCLDIDDPNESIVFSALDSVTIEILGVPDLDLTIDCVALECDRPGGNLAEVDTFAQCDEFGAYAFAESLAASSAAVDMMFA